MKTIFTRNNVLSALLALCTAVEFCYDLGERFVIWYRNGGRESIIQAIALTITAIVWTVSTARLGVAVIRRDGPTWLTNANTIRHQVSRAFSYEYAS